MAAEAPAVWREERVALAHGEGWTWGRAGTERQKVSLDSNKFRGTFVGFGMMSEVRVRIFEKLALGECVDPGPGYQWGGPRGARLGRGGPPCSTKVEAMQLTSSLPLGSMPFLRSASAAGEQRLPTVLPHTFLHQVSLSTVGGSVREWAPQPGVHGGLTGGRQDRKGTCKGKLAGTLNILRAAVWLTGELPMQGCLPG